MLKLLTITILTFIPVATFAAEKVTLCHKGQTITISKSAVQKHLKHGDTLGSCSEAGTVPETELQPDVDVVPEAETVPETGMGIGMGIGTAPETERPTDVEPKPKPKPKPKPELKPEPKPEPHTDFQLNLQFSPHTGEQAFDDFLIDINRIAGRRINDYIVDLSSAFKVPREKVIFLMYNERMQPADVLMILQIARLSGQPHKKLIQQFKRHRRKGWGAVAISLGIKPGSRMFLLLKEDIPHIIVNYVGYAPEWKKGSKRKKEEKGSKRKKKGSKGKKEKKGSKGKK